MKTVECPARDIEVLTETDVLVCGGGPAGIAAACSAARHGADVVLLERWPTVGGMATNALVNIWHTSDRTRQVIYGLVEEAIERCGGGIRRYENFPDLPDTHEFNPEVMRRVFFEMLRDAGVRVFCNIFASEPLLSGHRIRGVAVDTKSGRKVVLGRIVIDATGDGDVAAAAGLETRFGRPADGRVQGATMVFSLTGVDAERVHRAGPEAADRVIARMIELRNQGEFPPFNEGNCRILLQCQDYQGIPAAERPWNMCPVAGNPLDEAELTAMTSESLERIERYLELWRGEMPGYERARLLRTGFALGLRESRRVIGRTTLTAEMVVNAQKQRDAVGHGFWMVDIHDPKGSGHTTWTDQAADAMPPPGASYHIPLGMCLNDAVPNLAVVGRCASSTHAGHASVRIQTHCMVMGQGVGTAAALALRNQSETPAEVATDVLQTTLRADGVFLEDVPE